MLVQHFLIIQYIHILFCQVLSGFISLLIKQRHAHKCVRISCIIQIKIRIIGHGKDLSAVHLHDDTAYIFCAISRMEFILVLLVELQQIFLYNTLDIGIYGRHQGIAIFCCDRFSFQI